MEEKMMGKKWSLVILGVFLLIALTIGCGSSRKTLLRTSREMLVEELTKQKKMFQEEIENKKRLEKKVQGLEKEKKVREKLEAENEKINMAKINDLEKKVPELEKKVQELEKEKDALEKRKAEKKGELEKKVQQLEREREALEKMKAENEKIKLEFQDYAVKSQIEIWEAKKGLVISFIDKVLFESGKAEIKPQAYPALGKVAQILGNYSNRPVLIEGHTDNVPIGPRLKSRYQTNWELSTARAVAILRYLIKKHSLPPEQLAAAGYGKYHPIDSNETAEGRQKNRRVEIVIMPEKIVRE